MTDRGGGEAAAVPLPANGKETKGLLLAEEMESRIGVNEIGEGHLPTTSRPNFRPTSGNR